MNNKSNISAGLLITIALYGCNRSPIHHKIDEPVPSSVMISSATSPVESSEAPISLEQKQKWIDEYKQLHFIGNSYEAYQVLCQFYDDVCKHKGNFREVLETCRKKTGLTLWVCHLSMCLTEGKTAIVENALYAGVVDTTSTQWYRGAPDNQATLRYWAEEYKAISVIKALDEVEPFGDDILMIRDKYKKICHTANGQRAYKKLRKFYDYVSKKNLNFCEILNLCVKHTGLKLTNYPVAYIVFLHAIGKDRYEQQILDDILNQVRKSDAFDTKSLQLLITSEMDAKGNWKMKSTELCIEEFIKVRPLQ